MPTIANAESVESPRDYRDNPQPAKRKMSTALFNFWVDLVLLVAVVFTGWVSAMLQYVFPQPTSAGGWELWGLDYNQWRDLQFFSLGLCALLALEHVVLHWTWVCSVLTTHVLRSKTRLDEGAQVIYGVGFFIVLLLVLVATIVVAAVTVNPPSLP